MGKKPLAGAMGLLWVGLALSCVSGPGCMGGGQKKPFPPGSIRENPNARPPAGMKSPSGVNDLNKLPPLQGSPVGTSGTSNNPNKLMGSTPDSTVNRPAVMQTGNTTTTGFEKGPKVPASNLPGGTPMGALDGPEKMGLDPLPPMGTQTANFGNDTLRKAPASRPLVSGGAILPKPPGPGRDPITGTSTPMPILGAPGSPLPPDSLALPSSPSQVVPVGSTSNFPPSGNGTVTTRTAPPVVTGLPGDYTAPGANMSGEALPAIGSPTP